MILRFVVDPLCLMGRYRYAILRNIALPICFYLVLQAVIYSLSSAGSTFKDIGVLLHIPLSLAEMAIVTVISINTMRTVLLDEKSVPLSFHKREFKFFICYIGFLVVWIIPSTLVGVSFSLVFYSVWMFFIPIAFLFIALFFTIRLLLVLVGVAVDRKISLRDSFVMTHGPQWALFVSLAIIGTLFFMFYYFWGVAAGLIESEWLNPLSYMLVLPLFDLCIYVLVSIVLSVLYAEVYRPIASGKIEKSLLS